MERNRNGFKVKYGPIVTNYKYDYSKARDVNWISHHQYRATHHTKTDDGTAKIMYGIGIVLLLMFVIALAI